MKTYLWLIGPSCSGKSFYAEKLAEKLNIPFMHLDCMYNYLSECNNNMYIAYQQLLKSNDKIMVIDGIVPFHNLENMKALKDTLGNSHIIYLVCNIPYSIYKLNIDKRRLEAENTIMLTKRQFQKEILFYKSIKKDNRYIEISNISDLDKITDEDLRSINYQHTNLTDVKWKQLNIFCDGKTILDLGCSTCWYENFAKIDGAIRYKGLDVNKAYLFNDNAYYFDLNYLENWTQSADIVISTSVYHYINDKEKFIKQVARLTKEIFVFETPLSRLSGKVIECEPNRNLLFVSKLLLEFWIKKYFKSFKCLGKSITEDDSYRLIYHCFK